MLYLTGQNRTKFLNLNPRPLNTLLGLQGRETLKIEYHGYYRVEDKIDYDLLPHKIRNTEFYFYLPFLTISVTFGSPVARMDCTQPINAITLLYPGSRISARDIGFEFTATTSSTVYITFTTSRTAS